LDAAIAMLLFDSDGDMLWHWHRRSIYVLTV
jgi:hypothetical protein